MLYRADIIFFDMDSVFDCVCTVYTYSSRVHVWYQPRKENHDKDRPLDGVCAVVVAGQMR